MKRKRYLDVLYSFPDEFSITVYAPTFANAKDAYNYFTRHLEGQPYVADLSDDDDKPIDIFDAYERDDSSFYPDNDEGEAVAEHAPDNAIETLSDADDEGALATEEEASET